MMQPFVPWPHLGQPSDIAAAARFFASDESGWVTGDVMVVDGGLAAASPGILRRGGIRKRVHQASSGSIQAPQARSS